jgi:uncharacterized protein
MAATNARPTIFLRTGATFDFLDPSNSKFTIQDIAHGLSNICRYAGQCREFYSVAEHSVFVSETAKGFEYQALMHDAAEAFMGDMPGPLKQLLPEYRRLETAIEQVVFARFGVATPFPRDVKLADLRVLAAEQNQLFSPGADAWARGADVDPAPIIVQRLPPAEARQFFLERFEQVAPHRNGR